MCTITLSLFFRAWSRTPDPSWPTNIKYLYVIYSIIETTGYASQALIPGVQMFKNTNNFIIIKIHNPNPVLTSHQNFIYSWVVMINYMVLSAHLKDIKIISLGPTVWEIKVLSCTFSCMVIFSLKIIKCALKGNIRYIIWSWIIFSC